MTTHTQKKMSHDMRKLTKFVRQAQTQIREGILSVWSDKNQTDIIEALNTT